MFIMDKKWIRVRAFLHIHCSGAKCNHENFSSAKSGSFIRSSAVNAGKNLLEEMCNRYVNLKQYDTVKFGSTNVDLVNMTKIYEKQKSALILC